MLNLGKVRPGATIRIPFSTFDKDDGSSITMTSYAVADILIYKDGSTTERASTAGFTATTDFDAKTGKHLIVIDLADNTTAGFFAAGSEYLIAIDAVTVDGVTTGGWVARFIIGQKGSWFDTTIATLSTQTSFTLTSGPAEDDAINGHWAIIHDVASAVQCSWVQISDYTGSTKTVTLAAGATFTAAATDNISIMGPMPLQPTTTGRTIVVDGNGIANANVESWNATSVPAEHTAGYPIVTIKDGTGTGELDTASGVVLAKDHTGANLATAAALDAVDNVVDTEIADIQARLPAALVGGRMDSSVGAMAANVLTASALAADAVDEIWDEPLVAAGTPTARSALLSLASTALHSGTAQAGGTNTITLDVGASAVDGFYKESLVAIYGGTGAGQGHHIVAYNGTTKVATIDHNWATQPDATSTFSILAGDSHDITHSGRMQSATATTATLDPDEHASDDIHNGDILVTVSGTGYHQVRRITDYNGTTKVATVDSAWVTNPDSTTGYYIYPGQRGSTHAAADVWSVATRSLTILDEDSTTLDLDATIRSAVGLAAANLDTQLADLPTVAEFEARTLAAASYATAAALDAVDNFLDTEVAAILEDTGTTLPAQISALLTTALTESYRGAGNQGSVAQLLYELTGHTGRSYFTGLIKTVTDLAGDPAMTFTVDADPPSSIEETT